MMSAESTTTHPLLVGRTDMPILLGMAQRSFDRLRAAGKIGPREIRLGGKVLYNADELRAWASSADSQGNLPDRAAWLAMKRIQS